MKLSYREKGILVLLFILAGVILFFVIRRLSELIGYVSIIKFIGLLVIFYFWDYLLKVDFKLRHYLYVLFVGFFGIFLGYMGFVYFHYDKLFHLIGPVLLTDILYYNLRRYHYKKKEAIVFSFFVAFSLLCFYEIIEFLLDFIFNTHTQGCFFYSNGIFEMVLDRNTDTMIDLIFGIIGSFSYCFFRFFRKN
ncbi:hypothetical protein GF386_06845 [Candidatus Pacearchaeota archaeon]|nr:hypothetical protein [Candidatus Pacearchaeota archaeon]MBD3283798.1 hypothetical protein [Candidatus Pacearchaeota archaeon]